MKNNTISQEEKRRLKRQISIYTPIKTQLILNKEDKHFSQIDNQKATITLGENAPYRYISYLSKEGYEFMLEGFLFHEIAQLIYTDYHVMFSVYNEAQLVQRKANEFAKKYHDKQIKVLDLKKVLTQYIQFTNLPLLLKSIEDGAIENSMGIDHPETWNAMMYARATIIKSFIQEKHQIQDQKFLMDKIMKEIMAICTYGYRFSLHDSIVYLPYYLPNHFQEIRKLAIQGRLQSQTTLERLEIAKKILNLCQPIIDKNVNELFDIIRQTTKFENLPNSLFSQDSEMSVSFGKNQNSVSQPQQTKNKYHIDISDEEFDRIESLESQNEKALQQKFLQEIGQRKRKNQLEKSNQLKHDIEESTYIQNKIIFSDIQPHISHYGQIAMRTKNISISRSNQMARMMKRERMYATKSTTKHKLEYGRKLDQHNLYRATIDGHVFMKHNEGQKKDLCVYILVDNSESMSGEKIINAMKGCYELARVMQTLNIPFHISSHKTIGTSVQMTKIISFQECKKRNTLDRIYAMHVSGGTHEDIALEQALKELSEYKRHRKGFVFVLSDGDTHGIQRIHQLTHFYKKEKNIDIIGIGIQTIQIMETYPNHIFIKDLDSLPHMLIEKLKEIAL